ncbi:hypothetical protein SAMN04488563_5153 [Jiangella alkaliphila]|uniref:Uncharacterized protein n=1 Tax=Jiangella alkaliphila TaxID=419479 RepID=A0A1H2L6S5_9ACTN|nr:hypothetical protein SAMN04488563_5153 [Jiangella alkaliphila]
MGGLRQLRQSSHGNAQTTAGAVVDPDPGRGGGGRRLSDDNAVGIGPIGSVSRRIRVAGTATSSGQLAAGGVHHAGGAE